MPIRKIQFEYTKGGKELTVHERRMKLFEVMCERRHDTISNLAFEFKVSERTIRYDIEKLTCSYPIYTTQGTGGGVHIVDGYRYGIRYMTSDETKFLESIAKHLSNEEMYKLQRIIDRYRMPMRGAA